MAPQYSPNSPAFSTSDRTSFGNYYPKIETTELPQVAFDRQKTRHLIRKSGGNSRSRFKSLYRSSNLSVAAAPRDGFKLRPGEALSVATQRSAAVIEATKRAHAEQLNLLLKDELAEETARFRGLKASKSGGRARLRQARHIDALRTRKREAVVALRADNKAVLGRIMKRNNGLLASVAAVQSQLEALSEMGDVPSGSRYTRPLWPCTSGNKVFSA